MVQTAAQSCPLFFRELLTRGDLKEADIRAASDGFFAAARSLSQILISRGITTFPNEQDQTRSCSRFFDDWFLYAVPGEGGHVYGLFKMREQESDALQDIPADGDTPGVTISFIAFDTGVLLECLMDPSQENRKKLNREINRVVADRGQRHHGAMKAYFIRPEAEGPYLIAELYVSCIAVFAREGKIPVPAGYAALYRKNPSGRLPRFIHSNNTAAGHMVCDHAFLFISDPRNLSLSEKQAILATHTANVSFHSFAAEVRYHACFLAWFARLPLPSKSAYASAIRADMTISDQEFQGPAPYYRLSSRLVQQQRKYHRGY